MIIYDNMVDTEIKARLIAGNACYDYLQKILRSSLTSRVSNPKTYETDIKQVVIYGCKIKIQKNEQLLIIWVRSRDKFSVK